MRLRRGIITILSLSILAGPFFAESAMAADFCEDTVYAGNDTVDPDAPALLEAITKLETEGVDVHIIIGDSVDDLEPEQWIERAMSDCPNWANQAGDDIGIRTMIVSVAINDQITDAFFGSALTFDLGGANVTDSIRGTIHSGIGATQGEDVNPGLVAGLNRVYSLLTAPEPAPQQQQPVAPQEPEEPFSFPTWGFWLIGMVVGLMVLSLVATWLLGKIRNAQERRRLYEKVQASAMADIARVTSEVGNTILNADETKASIERIRATYMLGEATEVTGLNAQADRINSRLTDLNSTYLTVTMGEEPTTTTGWEVRGEAARALLEEGRQLTSDVRAYEHEAGAYSKLIASADQRLREVDIKLAAIDEILAGHRTSRLKTDTVDKMMADVREIVAKARAGFGSGMFVAGHAGLDEAFPLIKSAKDEAEALPRLASGLIGRMGKLQTRLGQLREMQSSTEALYGQMVDEFGPGNLSDVDGFGSEADAMLDEAELIIPQIEELVGLEVQDYATAREVVSNAGLLLKQAQTQYQEVKELEVALINARKKATALHGRLGSKLEDALRYCRSVESDAGDDEIQELEKLGVRLKAAGQALSKRHADYQRLLNTLIGYDQVIDQQTASAESDYRDAERLRAELEEIKAEALDSITQTTGYIKGHSGDVKKKRSDELKEVALRANRRTHGMTLAEQILFWRAIDNDADKVLKSAKSNVSSAKSARRTTYSSSSSGRSSGFSGSSSGRSSGFGSIGSSSGRSSGFSSSIGRSSGGRSKGW